MQAPLSWGQPDFQNLPLLCFNNLQLLQKNWNKYFWWLYGNSGSLILNFLLPALHLEITKSEGKEKREKQGISRNFYSWGLGLLGGSCSLVYLLFINIYFGPNVLHSAGFWSTWKHFVWDQMWAISSKLLREIYSGRDWILLLENKNKQRDRPGRRSEEKEVMKGALGPCYYCTVSMSSLPALWVLIVPWRNISVEKPTGSKGSVRDNQINFSVGSLNVTSNPRTMYF